MIGYMILKIMTTLVLTVLAISALWYAPKQKTASDGVFFFATAMFLAFGITFMWV
jgi:hypothetical protein